MTKRLLFLSLTAIGIGFTAHAQETAPARPESPISRGHFSIGTNLGIANLTAGKGIGDKTVLEYDLALRPSLGYMLTDHWMVSAELFGRLYGTSIRNYPTSKSAGIGLAARYYFGRSNTSTGAINRFRLFAEAGGSFERNWSTSQYNGELVRNQDNSTQLRAGFGFNYLLNENIAFEGGLSGVKTKARDLYYGTSGSILRMELGVRVFLRR